MSMGRKPIRDTIHLLEKYNPTFVRKRRLQLISFGIRNFFLGIQYSTVLPSAWKYLESLGAPDWYYGLVIAIYPLSAIIASPVVGNIFDRTKRTKEIMSVLNFIQATGSLIYALPYSPWLPLLGRFLEGIGASAKALELSAISWITVDGQRVSAISYVINGAFAGLLLGPPLNVLYEKINVKVGEWHIDYRNAAGVFCAFLWLLVEVLMQFMMSNLARDYVDNFKSKEHLSEGSLVGEEELETICLSDTGEENTGSPPTDKPKEKEMSTWKVLLQDVMPLEVGGIYFSIFMLTFYLYQAETLLPLVTQEDFGWDIVKTSAVYLAAAVYNFCLYIIIGRFGRRMPNLIILIAVELCGVLSSLSLLSFQMFRSNQTWSKVFFFLWFSITILGLPFGYVYSNSLLSKVTSPRVSGLVFSAGNMAMMLSKAIGPVWGSLVFHSVILYISISLALYVICIIWLFCSSKYLKDRESLYSGGNLVDTEK